MKFKYLIPIILVIIIIIIVLILNKKKDNSITNFKSFRLFYTKGYAMNADISYELIDKDNKLIALIKPYGISDEDKLEIEVSSDVKKEVIEVLQKYQDNGILSKALYITDLKYNLGDESFRIYKFNFDDKEKITHY